MKQENYHTSITVNVTPEEAFDKINRVSDWWAKKLDGHSVNLNDVFTVHFGKTYVTFKITESVEGKKITWTVIDCYLHWVKDKTEWNGTRVMFDISKKGKETRIDFTHIGLVPAAESYENCEKGWNEHVTESLLKLLKQGEGMPV